MPVITFLLGKDPDLVVASINALALLGQAVSDLSALRRENVRPVLKAELSSLR